MKARVLMMLGLLVLGGCTLAPAVRQPQSAPPVVTLPPPSASPPPVQQAPAPVVESQPSVPLPEPSAPVVLPAPEIKPGPATPASALLASVQSAIAGGDLNRAAALCERALRISPRDAQLWYQLALIRYQQRRNDDAIGAARRAQSMAGKDVTLATRISALLAQLQGR